MGISIGLNPAEQGLNLYFPHKSTEAVRCNGKDFDKPVTTCKKNVEETVETMLR